jgi:hypothetical protein
MKIIRGREKKVIEESQFEEFSADGWKALKPEESPAISNSQQKETQWQLQKEAPESSNPVQQPSEKSKATPLTRQRTQSTQRN